MRPEQLDGSTQLYGIVGDPISAVRSPEVFNAMFSHRGVNAVLVPMHVGEEDIASAWAGLSRLRNLRGLVVTMPHKARVVALLDDVGAAGRLVGAVNAARREPDGRWTGDMFDGVGFVDGLRREGHDLSGWNVRLLGLGGAGAAIAIALAQAGVAGLTLHDPDIDKRDRLVRQLQAAFPTVCIATETASGRAFDAVVNATPLGMKSRDPLPFDPAELPGEALVVDVITKPEITPLLQRAIDTGHRVHSGKHMHLGQARRVAAFFGYELD
ncbi:shikimate dehydrogenase family protein [Variovorax sp. DT-64]|uniref:shikimate dehydrogenase family protein n=1 Tax=Variovorax sp. DT-64 TaxID=3396160 RepID=UPI003F1C9A7A